MELSVDDGEVERGERLCFEKKLTFSSFKRLKKKGGWAGCLSVHVRIQAVRSSRAEEAGRSGESRRERQRQRRRQWRLQRRQHSRRWHRRRRKGGFSSLRFRGRFPLRGQRPRHLALEVSLIEEAGGPRVRRRRRRKRRTRTRTRAAGGEGRRREEERLFRLCRRVLRRRRRPASF